MLVAMKDFDGDSNDGNNHADAVDEASMTMAMNMVMIAKMNMATAMFYLWRRSTT